MSGMPCSIVAYVLMTYRLTSCHIAEVGRVTTTGYAFPLPMAEKGDEVTRKFETRWNGSFNSCNFLIIADIRKIFTAACLHSKSVHILLHNNFWTSGLFTGTLRAPSPGLSIENKQVWLMWFYLWSTKRFLRKQRFEQELKSHTHTMLGIRLTIAQDLGLSFNAKHVMLPLRMQPKAKQKQKMKKRHCSSHEHAASVEQMRLPTKRRRGQAIPQAHQELGLLLLWH